MNKQIEFFESKLAFEIDAFDLFQALSTGDKIVLVDARQTHGYEKEHIPGAISLPYNDMSEATTKDFDPALLYVTYCQGIECNGSTKGALSMSRLGFKVKELIGGLSAWKLDGFETEGTEAQIGAKIDCAC